MYYINKNKRSCFFDCIIVFFLLLAGMRLFFFDDIIQLYLNFSGIIKSEEVKADENIKIERKIYGYSSAGRAIEGYEIGSGNDTVFLIGAMHGNEMASTDLLNRLMLEIALNPNLVSSAKKIIIIPVANPDGYYERGDKLNSNGVNLDLNFETSDWQEYGPEGTYAGSEPFSELESQTIRKIVEKYKPNALISYHSYGSLVSPEANESSIRLANWYIGKTGYKYYDIWDYPGTATKWFTQFTGNPSVTVELSKDSLNNWETNKEALLELISGYVISL